MHPAQHSPNRPDPTPPTTGAPAETGPAPGPADLIHRRHLEKMVTWTGRERLRGLWYRLRLTVAEMNYATRRTVEVQAPWITATAPAEPARARTPSTSNQNRPLSSAAGDPPAIAKRHTT